MPLNAFGQYVPNITPIPGSFSGSTQTFAGSGSPEGVVTADASSGTATYLYWDYTNNLLYSKDSGTGNTGWVLAGGSGTLTTLSGAVNPEGAVVGSPGWLYYDTVANIVYAKRTGAGNTGWQEMVTAPP